ncbi:DUF4215 domain-containing protein [Pyxidicoccus fallax]|uniref:DUF4215 domain-containing protein n=1 Tax=Pyxidicoccus fallax TaxID=394095 RepID=A0A848LLY9_9BACT|nr:DUF4215 domain-containing protein [Pyxidicoccus fallax]NMO18663.1 DUF4215 domain-containing protein [Pyxidicoccus fallax]
MNTRTLLKSAALALALVTSLTGCETNVSKSSTPEPVLASQTSSVVGDGRLQSNEQCDDGNTTSGDGCSATGTIETGYLCHVPGRLCSLASLCGNNAIDPGEACDDGNTTQEGNGCTATCDLSLCGNGAPNNRQWPNFDQEICDDGNRFEGDGCSRLCEVEPGFACAGSPSRCVTAGIAVFNTGVDDNNRRLESGADPHWFYSGTTTGAALGTEFANDWPQEVQTARFMAAPLGAPTCVYQDFMVPTTTNISQFRVRIATFNDNAFESARVNGVPITPVIVSEPAGQPWQKSIIRELGTNAAWRHGLNRIELCNENQENPPNAFRYLFVDAYDDRCGDGDISPREECDDGDATSGDGCSVTCAIEPGYACVGEPSVCTQSCGNGTLNPGEECDDGNTTNNDGCNTSCRVEPPYSCPTPGEACVQTCGNSAIDPSEQCDDGNVVGSDGCSAACRIESGYECSGTPSVCVPRCGNSRLDSGEQCDDGNTRLNDGCSNACTLELGYACPTPGQACVQTCGNGNVNPGEQCDDGNQNPGDGCGIICDIESGYACSTPATGPSVCTRSCGNGTLNTNEECDDGDTDSGDGCSASCRVETGYSCTNAPNTPSACATDCGDGIRAGTETCDDANETAGDGCSATCQVESGYSCPTPGQLCVETCGNGTVNPGEQCDDNNTTPGDGCSAACVVESGYTCSGSAPSACRTTCGDGIRAGAEVCDDGNLENGDACSSRCLLGNGETCNASGVCDSGYCRPSNPSVCADPNQTTTPVITGPANGSTVGTQTPAINGTGTPGNTVTVREGSTVICTATVDANGNWTCTPTTPLPEGPHTITATATSGTGTSPASTPVTFTVDLEAPPPAPVITGPANGSTVSTQTPPITGTSTPNSTVTVREGSTVICTATTNSAGNWTCTPTTPLPEGSHTITATATNTSGETGPASTPVTFDVDLTPVTTPVITGPANNTTVGTQTPPINGTGTPGNTVTVREGSTVLCTATVDANGNWSCTPTTPLPEGPHTITATASDNTGDTSPPSTPVTFTVDLTPLAAPVITGPANNSILNNPSPAISGTGTAGTTVTVREGDTVICTATVAANGSWSCTPATPLADGAHNITATATDGTETSPLSNTDTFVIDTRAPDTSIPRGPGTRSDEGDASFEYDSTEDGVSYECSLDGGPFRPCADSYEVNPGEHTLQVRSIDAAGNVDASPAEYTWTVVDTRAFAGGGCSAAPASSGLALLALLGLRRRTRRQNGR